MGFLRTFIFFNTSCDFIRIAKTNAIIDNINKAKENKAVITYPDETISYENISKHAINPVKPA